ncbi:dynein light chain [Pyrus ussuriensis x Pyrus communis]|uniref:Dynein light chain n=1 Tax=Pyrus ussuriensis x Pyrus communis TaxID=2448454 RepID=A0A5N5GK26_9ROSA|nr:dynein light chain [Pyrus ussuriensis x Pyrus communis]
MEKALKLKEKQHQGQAMQISKQQRREPQDQIKLAVTAITLNARLRSSDMPAHMQNHALRHTRSLLDSPPNPKTRLNPTHLARALKKEFDSVYGPAWHCVVGKSFGSFVTHSAGGFVYFSVDESLSVLLFKTEVQLVTEPRPPQPSKPSTLSPC